MFVFVAGAANEELSLSVELQMRWRVQRMLMQAAYSTASTFCSGVIFR
jgi:hypothetical protein